MLDEAIAAALAAGDRVRGSTSPNPPVGCALIDAHGALIATGGTSPAGGPHAEINALAVAGERARGATAVVTLEPCNHVGRTGPCSQALIDAGVTAVYYLNADPFPAASGGARHLAAHGVDVHFLDQAAPGLEPWLKSVTLQRPHVTLKFAQTLDGFTAAADGTSQWITGPQARRDVHSDRLKRDAIIIGTGTALADNPALTARDVSPEELAAAPQPARVVIGTTDLTGRASRLEELGYQQFPTIQEALASLYRQGMRDVLVEGGARLAGGFLRAGLVDQVRAYLAPLLLGQGTSTIADWGADTLAGAERFARINTVELGPDIRLDLQRRS